MIYRWFPLIAVAALAAGVAVAAVADVQPQKPIPFILPASLMLPPWILTDNPSWRYSTGEPLPQMRIYREDEFNEIDAECVGCRPAGAGMLVIAMALSAIIALLVRPIVRAAAGRGGW